MDAGGARQRHSRGQSPIDDSLEGGIHRALKRHSGDMMQSNNAIRTQPTVLVVDHGAEVRAVARRLLEGVGYFVKDLCRFPYSVVAIALALFVLAMAVFFHINVFNLPVVNVIGIERNEVGQITIAFLFIVPAFFVDRVVARQRSHEQQLRAEQLRVLRMTMRTVQDISQIRYAESL
jgi:hypothetical protein